MQYLSPRAAGPPELLNVTGVANQCWAFTEFVDPDGKTPPQLLLTASDGLYRINGAVAEPIVESANRSFGTFVVTTSRIDPHRIWVGLADGLASLTLDERPLGERGPRGRGLGTGAEPAPVR